MKSRGHPKRGRSDNRLTSRRDHDSVSTTGHHRLTHDKWAKQSLDFQAKKKNFFFCICFSFFRKRKRRKVAVTRKRQPLFISIGTVSHLVFPNTVLHPQFTAQPTEWGNKDDEMKYNISEADFILPPTFFLNRRPSRQARGYSGSAYLPPPRHHRYRRKNPAFSCPYAQALSYAGSLHWG